MTFDAYIEKQVEEALSRGAMMQQIELLKLLTAPPPDKEPPKENN